MVSPQVRRAEEHLVLAAGVGDFPCAGRCVGGRLFHDNVHLLLGTRDRRRRALVVWQEDVGQVDFFIIQQPFPIRICAYPKIFCKVFAQLFNLVTYGHDLRGLGGLEMRHVGARMKVPQADNADF